MELKTTDDVYRHLGKIVAERRLHTAAGDEIIVCIGEPQGGTTFWQCPCAIIGFKEPITGFARGVDAMQALLLSFAWIREALAPHQATLRWLVDGEPLGFPRHVPEDMPQVAEEVEKLIGREDRRIADLFRNGTPPKKA